MSFYSKFYSGNYKKYLIAPAIILVICLTLIFSFGIKKGIDLSGGTLISIYTTEVVDSESVRSFLQTQYGFEEVTVSLSKGISNNRLDIQYLQEANLSLLRTKIVDIKAIGDQTNAIKEAKNLLLQYNFDLNTITVQDHKTFMANLDLLYNTEKNKRVNEIITSLSKEFGFNSDSFAIKEISPTLSASFYSKAILVSLIAIIGIVLVIFLAYREFVPSVAIIACGLIDILGGLAGMAIFNIPLSLISIPTLLMLLGYSIDTDIMLTTKLLKRNEGSNVERAGDSMRTGLYMTSTAIIAVTVMLIFSLIYNVSVFFEISIVLLFGLIVDIIATWMMNGPILLWYVEHKKK
jgi:preprotein translocase subunit SecF